jgi:hypothetical protein
MFRIRAPDLAVVVYVGHKRSSSSYRCDVVLGPAHGENRSEVERILQAIDERKTVGRPVLNVKTA